MAESFVVGEKFSSYDKLKDTISEYESTKCVQLPYIIVIREHSRQRKRESL